VIFYFLYPNTIPNCLVLNCPTFGDAYKKGKAIRPLKLNEEFRKAYRGNHPFKERKAHFLTKK